MLYTSWQSHLRWKDWACSWRRDIASAWTKLTSAHNWKHTWIGIYTGFSLIISHGYSDLQTPASLKCASESQWLNYNVAHELLSWLLNPYSRNVKVETGFAKKSHESVVFIRQNEWNDGTKRWTGMEWKCTCKILGVYRFGGLERWSGLDWNQWWNGLEWKGGIDWN